MRCSVLAPKGLKGQRRTSFLDAATKQFRAQMGKKTTSGNWGHSEEAVKRFAAAMQEARDRAPEEERWNLNKNRSHGDMAHAALVVYDIMCDLLPKYGRHRTRDDKLYQDVHSGIGNKPVSAIVDTGANGVLVTLSMVQRKGLLGQIDSPHKVAISQANAAQKFQTYGVLKGGVLYQMMSAHGRSLTVTLPCHVAPVGSDLIGSNKQGPLL